MNIEEKLKSLIISRYGSVMQFAEASGLPYQTVVSILKRGVMKAGLQNIIDICKVLNLSVDSLAEGRIVPLPQDDIPENIKEKELPALMDAYISSIMYNDQITLDDEVLTPEEVAYLDNGFGMLYDQIRAKRLLKYAKVIHEMKKDSEKEIEE